MAELYAKIFYTSCWINFLTTYSKVRLFSDSFKFCFKGNDFSCTCIQGYFIALQPFTEMFYIMVYMFVNFLQRFTGVE